MPASQHATLDDATEIELDLGRYELRRHGSRVKLAKKPMDLLIFLVSRRGQLVSRQEIFTRLWSADLFVDTEQNTNSIVRKIRFALGDDSERPRFLETVVGKGYRFIGPVHVIEPLHLPIAKTITHSCARPRDSQDPVAQAEFLRGARLASGASAHLLEACVHLNNSVTRDPGFALAHATLSVVCATLHFEFDPAHSHLQKAEFHCARALELDPLLADAHVANAFLLWGPSKNFQHLAAIEELKRAIHLEPHLPHAYNRLGAILAHIGLLDAARSIYERGSAFNPQKSVSPSIAQVYFWNFQYAAALEKIQQWRAQSPSNKYPYYFAASIAIAQSNWKQSELLLKRALKAVPDEPLIVSLQGLFFALTGKSDAALDCLNRACANPKSFGHAHHTYYQAACILAVLNQSASAFEWLERSVSTGFACWPFFQKDPYLQNLRPLPEFDLLTSSLKSKYPAHLGLL